MEQMEVEVVETVAAVTRLLRRAAELAWTLADAAGHRSSRQLLALRIYSAADEASGLLPRRAWLDGPTPVGDDPAELLGSADQLLRRICVVGAPSRLLGLRALVAELVWEAIAVPVRDQRTVGEHLADSDALARELLLDVAPSHGPAMVRTWGRVVQSTAQLWRCSPPVSLAAPSESDQMVRLHGLAEGISQHGWSYGQGPCPQDQRLVRRRSLAKLANASSSDDALDQSFWGRPAMTDQHDLNPSEQLWSSHTYDDSSQTPADPVPLE